MIRITALKKLSEEEFEVTFSVKRKQQRQKLIFRGDLFIEPLNEFMPYLNPADADFQPFLRNNPAFTRKIFQLIAEINRENELTFPVVLPLEWEDFGSKQLKAA